MEKRPVRVTLLGQTYSLLAQGDPREVEQLAQKVDELMHEIARKSPNADSTRVAVLACMHLADQLTSLEKDLTSLKQRIDRKTEEFAVMLDQAIEPFDTEPRP
ncbi:MAG: cell division protein ZapA [Bryobacteraceae bacterium]